MELNVSACCATLLGSRASPLAFCKNARMTRGDESRGIEAERRNAKARLKTARGSSTKHMHTYMHTQYMRQNGQNDEMYDDDDHDDDNACFACFACVA